MKTKREMCSRQQNRVWIGSEHRAFGALMVSLALQGPVQAGPQPPSREAARTHADLTAEELLHSIANAYAKQQWNTAAEASTAFLRDYGGRAETTNACLRLKGILTQCHMQTRNWQEALPLLGEALQRIPPEQHRLRADLEFQQAVCQYETQQYTHARGSLTRCLEHSLRANPMMVAQPEGSERLSQVRLWIGNCLRFEKKPAEAAEYFHQIQSVLSGARVQEALLGEMQARIEARDHNAAWDMARQHQQALERVNPVLFHSLLLEIGSEFLSQAEWRKALASLTSVWNRERLLKSAKGLEAHGTTDKQLPVPPSAPPLGDHQPRNMETVHPVQDLQANTKFDCALQLRIAAAYQGLGRAHEAALVLEELVSRHSCEKQLEQPSGTLVELWGSLERWDKVLDAADIFQRTHPNSSRLPRIQYLKGCAQQAVGEHSGAVRTFTEILSAFPRDEIAPRAELMRAQSQRACGNNAEALALFESFCKTHAGHPLSNEAQYQIVETHADRDDFLQCRDAASRYLERYPKGDHRHRALLRRAKANHCLHDHEAALADVRLFMNADPEHPGVPDALHLQGDIHHAQGQIEAAIAAWEKIPPSASQAYEAAVFKRARALYASARFGELKQALQKFSDACAESQCLGGALDWYGKACTAQGVPEEANEWGWSLVSKLAGIPDARGVEDLLLGLARLSRSMPETYCLQLEQKIAAEDQFLGPNRRQPLATQLRWALGRQLLRSAPPRATELLLEASKRADVTSANPLLLADCADALDSGGFTEASVAMWRDLLKWHPNCAVLDRAILGMAKSEVALKHSAAALGWIARFEKEAAHSPLKPAILLMKSRLLEEAGDFENTFKILESLLQIRGIAGELKCEALYRTGEIHMRRHQPAVAIPYYQRIYVLNRHWPEWVARAYLRSGEAFEKLGDAAAARKTYLELIEFAPAESLPEKLEAQQRLR